MVKLIIASTILATAAAFLGVAPSAPAPQLHAAGIEDYIGADIETAGLWDPLGLSKDTDRLYRWRCVEIKHGRVAMLATMIFFIGVMETTVFKQDPAKARATSAASSPPLQRPAEKADKLKSELKNGRLAMMGIMGMLVTDQLTGLGPVTQLMTTKVVPF
ncbi:chlorophyll A-B binding protein [Aureococcus anophagefferens]|nr:chlorophyll A-B binding protein [Aureococcus anophagefferens]